MKKKKCYRYYDEIMGVHFTWKFPFIHLNRQTTYIDPVPCDMNPKSKHYSSINPEKVNLIKLDKSQYEFIQGLKAGGFKYKDIKKEDKIYW